MDEEALVRYRVKSGKVRYDGKTYGPRDIFKGPPNSFKDFEVECLDEAPGLDELEKDSDANYKIEPAGTGWFNVIDASTKEPINDKTLRKGEAEVLLADLLGTGNE